MTQSPAASPRRYAVARGSCDALTVDARSHIRPRAQPHTIERRRAEPPPALSFVCRTQGTPLTPRLPTQLFSSVSSGTHRPSLKAQRLDELPPPHAAITKPVRPNDFEFTGPRSGSGAMRGWAARLLARPVVPARSPERYGLPGCALVLPPRLSSKGGL